MLNNDFNRLVSLYKKYQKQQRNKRLLKLFGLAALIAVAYLFYRQTTQPVISPAATATNTTTQPAGEKNTTTQSAQEPPKESRPLQKTAVSTPKEEQMPKEVQKRTPPKKQTHKKEETFQLKVTQRKSLYKLLVDYKNNKTYNTAIKIAQFYLEDKEYDKAVKWAVEASKKDPTQAQSWIIYAQAKKALGKPEVAKRALGIYLKHNYSQSAQDLLDSL